MDRTKILEYFILRFDFKKAKNMCHLKGCAKPAQSSVLFSEYNIKKGVSKDIVKIDLCSEHDNSDIILKDLNRRFFGNFAVIRAKKEKIR